MSHLFDDRRVSATRSGTDNIDRAMGGHDAGNAAYRERPRTIAPPRRLVCRFGIGPHEAFLFPCDLSDRFTAHGSGHTVVSACGGFARSAL